MKKLAEEHQKKQEKITLMDCIVEIDDPRSNQGKKHLLKDILMSPSGMVEIPRLQAKNVLYLRILQISEIVQYLKEISLRVLLQEFSHLKKIF
jgi:hypothetical protein